MDISLEFVIVLMIALFFQTLFFRFKDDENQLLAITTSLISAITWFLCGPLWLSASPSVYGTAILFTSLGTINVLFVFWSIFKQLYWTVNRRNRRADLFE